MVNSNISKLLERSKNNKELVGIWQYSDDKGFSAGYVLDFDEDLIYFKHFTKYGKPDGIMTIQTEDVQSIDFNDNYLNALECLIQYSNILDKEDELNIDFSFDEDWNLNLIKQAEEKNIFISVEINSDKFYSGFVKDSSEIDFTLNCIGKMGEDEGLIVFRIEDVTQININDIDDRKRQLLYKWRNASL